VHVMALLDEPIGQMTADKSCTAGDQVFHVCVCR
jgi:hypothetical protein